MMTIGVVAALAVGQWPTAAWSLFFMRSGDYAERFTTERSRQALPGFGRAGAGKRRGWNATVGRSRSRSAQVRSGTVIVRPGETDSGGWRS